VFGRYEGDISYTGDDVSIRLDRSRGLPRYERVCCDERVVKSLSHFTGTIIINPVEPVNLPVPLARHLEIGFPMIALPPGTSQTLFLVFPLEIGVFLVAGGDVHVLDIFSLSKSKFSLYGTSDAGVITRWHHSEVYTTKPDPDRHKAGVLNLSIRNRSAETVEVSRAVFDSDSIHLFSGDRVEMSGQMEIFSPRIARTDIRTAPPMPGMERCIEIYTAKKIPVVQGKGFLMESGAS
jgi:hypothetical protein